MSRTRSHWLVLFAGLAAAAPAVAQDSVSTAGGLPGDALDAFRTAAPTFQVRDYVVDLAPLTSSWGHKYAVGPVLKSSRSTSTGTVYFNHLIGAQAASNRFGHGPFIRPSYDAWAAAGQGANPLFNTTPTDNGSGLFGTLNTSGKYAHRFGMAFMEFGGGPDATFGNGDDENGIISAVIGVQIRRLDRLYVSRTVAAGNKSTSAGAATAQLGLGGIDEAGNVHVLADGQGLLSGSRLANKNLIRTNSLLRDTSKVNNFLQSGGIATANDPASTQIVLESVTLSSTTFTTPTIIPASIAGRPVLATTDFASNLLYESAAGVMSTTRAHLPAPSGSCRGNVSFSTGVFAPVSSGAAAGTGALLSRTDGGTLTRGLTIFGLRTDGSVGGEREVQLPTALGSLVDPTDGFDPAVTFPPLANAEFSSYQSQVPFRGGNGQVALAVLPNGDLLAAALVAETGGGATLPQSQNNAIAVVRINASTGVASWTIAAHTGNAAGSAGGISKAILGDYGADGTPGTADAGEGDGVVDAAPIGRLASRAEMAPVALGPSISAPAMDNAGNLYFLAHVALNSTGGPLANKTVALIRANYNPALGPVGGAGGYQLEVLARQGDVIPGPNSQRNCRLAFMGLADADSADSGAIWSGNIVQDPTLGATLAATSYADPATLGVLAFRAKLIYDTNQDGQYIDPSTPPGTGGPDEAYNAVLAIMPSFKPGDFNRDGIVNPSDVANFVNRWFSDLSSGGVLSDWDGSGAVQPADIAAFINDWFASL